MLLQKKRFCVSTISGPNQDQIKQQRCSKRPNILQDDTLNYSYFYFNITTFTLTFLSTLAINDAAILVWHIHNYKHWFNW